VPAAVAYLGHPKTLSKRTKDLQLSLRPDALEQAKEVRGGGLGGWSRGAGQQGDCGSSHCGALGCITCTEDLQLTLQPEALKTGKEGLQ
jgi:hypothetical protein